MKFVAENQIRKQDYSQVEREHAQLQILKTVPSGDATPFLLGTPSEHRQVFVLGLWSPQVLLSEGGMRL